MILSFEDCLGRSKGSQAELDVAALRAFFGDSVDRVESCGISDDMAGIDYRVVLRRGATINVDAKLRLGCLRHWRDPSDPELTLEVWSKIPSSVAPDGRPGWTLDESKLTDYVLWTWDPDECGQRILMPFQLLRATFRSRCREWVSRYRGNRSSNLGASGARWESECVYVPASVVWRAMLDHATSECHSRADALPWEIA